MPIKTFTSADGLGSSFVSSSMRDSHGFLWFCTRDGLSRFDGLSFITYQIGKDAPPGIEQILETRNGIYWITTTGGLYRYDPNKSVLAETTSDARPTLNAEFVANERGFIFEDSKGNLWTGSPELKRIEEKDGKISFIPVELNLPKIPNVRFGVFSIFEGQDESLWLGTFQGLVRLLPDGRKIFYAVSPTQTDALSSAIEDSAGRIWFGRSSGVSILKPETIAELKDSNDVTIRKIDDLVKLQPKNQVNLPNVSGEIFKFTELDGFGNRNGIILYQTSDKHIWISAGDGVIEFDGQKFNSHTSEQGLQIGFGQMLEDLNGNLWLPWSNSVKRLDRHGLITFNEQDGIKSPAIISVGETQDGKIFATSGDFFINLIEEKGVTVVRPPIPLDARALWTSNTIFMDSLGEWWILTNEKLYRFAALTDLKGLATAKPMAIYSKDNGLKGNEIFHIFEDSKQNIWVSTRDPNSENNGFSRLNRADNSFYTFSEKENMPSKVSISSFAEDRHGNLWFGLYEGGLLKFADGQFKIFTVKDGLPDGVITSLLIDKEDRLWIGSSLKGLSRINNVAAEKLEFVNLTTDNGLTSNNIRCLAEDNFGNIYAGTARGVDRLSADGTRIRHFTVSDGLAGDFVVSAFKDKLGSLWFSTSNGVSKLIPEKEEQIVAPQVFFGGLRVAGEKRQIPELGTTEISNLELSSNQNNLQIDFFAIDFRPNESLRYQFMLEGADKDWNPPTEQRSVNYANLSAGNYRFLVRAVRSEGSIGEKSAVISFKVLSPIWQRWWFLLLVATAIGLVIYTIYRYRLKRLIELEKVRTRIATDLHDDIGSSLSQIAILSEVVRQKIGNNGANEPLTLIADTSREMVDSMSDIVWAINPNKDSLSDLIKRMRRFASDVLEAKDITFRFYLVEKSTEIALGADIRREVYLMFKECVNNLAKHSNATEAEISILIEGNNLAVKIKDNGKGFHVPPFDEHTTFEGFGGNGLLNLKKRTETLSGKFEIKSASGKGTEVLLEIPIKDKKWLSSFTAK